MFKRVKHILEMIRFSHTIFALPFAMLAAVMAWQVRSLEWVSYNDILRSREIPLFGEALFVLRVIRWQEVVGILVCMIAARSAAMAFNRLADRRVDAQNPRTATRHLPAGKISARSVLVFTVLSSAAFVAGTLLFLPNWLPLALSLPVLGFLLAYSYTKRFTSLAHFWLGASLMLAPMSAWIAIRGRVMLTDPLDILPAAMLGAAVLLWVAGFDIIYACQDADFDVRAKLYSVPAVIGVPAALRVAAVCHVGMIVMLAGLPFAHLAAGPVLNLGWIYWCAVAAVAVLLLYEHWLVRPDDLTRVNVAFFNVNAVVSLGLFIVGTIDLLT